jgi:hypothetical protein
LVAEATNWGTRSRDPMLMASADAIDGCTSAPEESPSQARTALR